MDRQTYLAKRIEEILNEHPTLKFRVLDHVADLDEFYGDMIAHYKEETVHFWCLLTDYMGEYIPIKNARSTIESCNLWLHIPVNFIDEVMAYLKTDFADSVVANEIKDATTGITTLMTMNIPSVVEEQMKDGVTYVIVVISFSFKSSGKFVFGNKVSVNLNGVEVVPYDGRQINQVKSNMAIQPLEAMTGGEITTDNVVKYTYSFYYEPREPFLSLLDEIRFGKQNVIYELETRFPSDETPAKQKVILSSGSVSYPIGNFIVLNCIFSLDGKELID